ncbi:hypothetical protein LCGC14_0305990 [marine sediment metagenome]|uniref:Peptidase M16 N-terminal domain-containing protein n=1 Tax=marine sediment metagenome TaxID=412755 RepID=A0A0F9TNZ5_9ZZZZ
MKQIQVKKKGNSTWVGIVVPVGSRDEENRIKGISHFTEHMLFKGTKNRTKEQIKREMDAYGATLNAYTGEEVTCYWVQIDNKYKDKAVDLLTDMVENPVFDKIELNKEREVIMQELKMYEDNPLYHIWDLSQTSMFPLTSGLGITIIGTKESLYKINQEEFKVFHEKYYKNPTLIIVGDIEEDVIDVFQHDVRFAQELKYSYDTVIKEREGISQACMTVSGVVPFLSHSSISSCFYLEMMKALCNAFSGRIFDVIREKNNLVYSTYFTYELLNCGTIIWSVFAGLDAKNIDKARRLIDEELTRPFTSEEVEFSLKKRIGEISLMVDSTATYGNRIVKSLNRQIPFQTYNNDYKLALNDVSYKVNDYQRGMKFNRNKLVAIVPKEK